jgi:hypothetical protein
VGCLDERLLEFNRLQAEATGETQVTVCLQDKGGTQVLLRKP